MSQSSSGPRPTPSPEPEARPTTDTTIIRHPTDMCHQAVRRALDRDYDMDLEGYDLRLVDAAASIDEALGRHDATPPGSDRDVIRAEISRLVETLADTPAPHPLEQFGPEDVDWSVHPIVSAESVLRSTLEALDRADATVLRTYLAGAGAVARGRLEASIQRVAEGPIARRVTALGLPTHAARWREIAVEDLPDRIASEMVAETSMASVEGTDRTPEGDWVSQLATLLEETALAVERGPAWGPALTSEEQATCRIAAQLYREIVSSVVHDAIAAEERLAEELEEERDWDAEAVASTAVRAVLEAMRAQRVPVTTDMHMATMTSGMLVDAIVEAQMEAALESAWPDIERGARREAAKAAKVERKKAKGIRKTRKAARRRGRRS